MIKIAKSSINKRKVERM